MQENPDLLGSRLRACLGQKQSRRRQAVPKGTFPASLNRVEVPVDTLIEASPEFGASASNSPAHPPRSPLGSLNDYASDQEGSQNGCTARDPGFVVRPLFI